MTRITFAAWLGSLVVLGGTFAAGARAQELPPKSYMKKNVFYLPVKIEDRVRGNLREVQLYSKDNPSKNWVLQERATPSQTYFTFRAPHDGEYWFTVVIVDKAGRPIPGDIRKEAPSLIVVLDTQQPLVDVQQISASPTEGTCFRCTVNDANIDLTKTRFYYQTADSMWRPVSPMPNQMDQYCIPAQAMFTGMVKVEACDLADNTVSREINMGAAQPAAATTQDPLLEPMAPVKNTGFTAAPEKGPVKTLPMMVESMSSKTPAPFPVEQVIGPDIEPPMCKAAKNAPAVMPTDARMPQAVEPEKSLPVNSGPVCSGQKFCSAPKQLVNKTHIFLQYQIDNTGPSGVGKVEFWLTRDKGMSWQKLCEDAKHQSPAEVDLPGEGLFGIAMVVSNGRGFGAGQPASGDTPDWWIEVDTTKPVAEVKGLRAGTGSDSGCVFVTWAVCDKNLAAEPIDLYYATSQNGPWQPIAQNLKNDGQYCWHMPANMTGEAFVRLVARDAAGNSTIADCTQPVTFDDMSRPHGRLTGVSTTMPTPENSGAQTVDLRK